MNSVKKLEKLVLFDLDGTLIDDDYRLTDDGIRGSIDSVQVRGWDVGLSSDSPYELLASWRTDLGMNGPIIAEKGAVVENGDELIFDQNIATEFSVARAAITDYLSGRQDTVVWQGNSTEAIRQKEVIGTPGQRSILINNLSRCSLRFYVRWVSDEGKIVNDDVVTQETFDELKPFYPALEHLSVDNNPTFGLLILADGTRDKRTGLTELLKRREYQQSVMAGNSMGDYIGGDLVTHYAVANADIAYRNRAILVNRPLTSGCIEVLNTLK